MAKQSLQSRTLLLIAAISFLVVNFIPEDDAVLDTIIAAGELLGIITLVIGIIRFNRELRQEKAVLPKS